MSADLHIISFDTQLVDIDLVREYAAPSALDLTPYDPDTFDAAAFLAENDRHNEIFEQLYGTYPQPEGWRSPLLDNTWIGQVSWMKAGMGGDANRYVPRVVAAVQGIYDRAGGVVQITDELIPQITTAFSLPHTSMYERPAYNPYTKRYDRSRGVGRARDVKRWLQANRGAYTFVGSW